MDRREVKGLLYLLTHLSPRMCLDLGEFELGVVGVHLTDLLSGRGAENLDRTGQMGRDFMSFTRICSSLVKKKQTLCYEVLYALWNTPVLTLIISTN